jgi:formylglycine-generating enzyme required for sulfatase activity
MGYRIRIGLLIGIAVLVLAGCNTGPDFIAAGSANASWTPEVRTVGELVLVKVPAGCFTLGRDSGPTEETPARRICLNDFWLGQTEVTNAQYAACVAAGACTEPANAVFLNAPTYADHPVVNVTHEQAAQYAAWRGGRLPSEYEWEYAARGPESWPYPWGEDAPTCELANIATCGTGTQPVGGDQRAAGASWVGARDMTGNVWEWTATWYDGGAYVPLEDGAVDPRGPAPTQMRVLRGSAWGEAMDKARATYRARHTPVSWSEHRGFRVVYDRLPPEEVTPDE